MTIGKFFESFQNRIEISVGRESFTFSSGADRIELRTLLHVSASDPPVVLSVGEPYIGADPSRKVELFNQFDRDESLRFESLTSFLKFGFQKLTSTPKYLRPLAVFTGFSSLNPALGGYQKIILAEAAASAGARGVEFKS